MQGAAQHPMAAGCPPASHREPRPVCAQGGTACKGSLAHRADPQVQVPRSAASARTHEAGLNITAEQREAACRKPTSAPCSAPACARHQSFAQRLPKLQVWQRARSMLNLHTAHRPAAKLLQQRRHEAWVVSAPHAVAELEFDARRRQRQCKAAPALADVLRGAPVACPAGTGGCSAVSDECAMTCTQPGTDVAGQQMRHASHSDSCDTRSCSDPSRPAVRMGLAWRTP